MPDHSSDGPSATSRASLRAERAAQAESAESGARGASADPAASRAAESAAPGPAELAARDPAELASPAFSDAIIERPPHQPRRDWRLGGRTVRRWREWLLAWAVLSLGVGILAGTLVVWLWASPWAAASATLLVWIGMLVPVVRALSLSRPAGLLRVRPVDLLFAVALGGMLRIVQGWFETAFGGSGALPSYPLVDGRLSVTWWVTDVLAPVVVAPVLEELFFRGVVLVSVYTVLRRPLGRSAAAIAGVLVSTALFVVAHASTGSASIDQIATLTLVSIVCGALVVLTGRLGGAVLVHVVFNASFALLALAGTFLA